MTEKINFDDFGTSLYDYKDQGHKRRFMLISQTNPNISMDYVICLQAKPVDEETQIQLRYIPDKLILEADAFEQYLLNAGELSTLPLETQALAILEDFNNEIVPRWVEISISSSRFNQSVMVEDRQPLWDNPALLTRLSPAL